MKCTNKLGLKIVYLDMDQTEYKAFKEILKKQRQEVTASKPAALKLLVDLGILTPKGNFTKAFKPAK